MKLERVFVCAYVVVGGGALSLTPSQCMATVYFVAFAQFFPLHFDPMCACSIYIYGWENGKKTTQPFVTWTLDCEICSHSPSPSLAHTLNIHMAHICSKDRRVFAAAVVVVVQR